MSDEKKWQFELEEYIKQGEPDRTEKSEAWQTLRQVENIDLTLPKQNEIELKAHARRI